MTEPTSGPGCWLDGLAAAERLACDGESSLGLGPPPEWLASRAHAAATLAPDRVHELTAEEAGEAAVTLMQAALFWQRAHGAALGRAKAAERRLALASAGRNLSATSYQERRAAAVRADPSLLELEKAGAQAELEANRLAMVAQRASDLAGALLALQASRRTKWTG